MRTYHLAFVAAWLGSVVLGKPDLYIGAKQFPKLIDATTQDLAAGLESGIFTSADLVKAYTARIMQVNMSLSAVTELNPDAMSIASQLDAERKNGTVRGSGLLLFDWTTRRD